MTAGTLLVVRHGPGRGRIDRYMEPVLESLRERGTEAAGHVRVHETGAPRPSLDGVVAVVFWLADPLREGFPACFEEAADLAEEARARGLAMVNAPEALSNSVKSRQARLWLDAGIETPRYMRYESLEELRAIAPGIGFPLVIRCDEDHCQRGMRVLPDGRSLAEIRREGVLLPGAAAPLLDVRASHRARGGRSPYARLHHKKRIYVLGSRVRTEHVFFSHIPLVSTRRDVFGRLHRLPAWRRAISRRRGIARKALAEDLAYWRRGEEHADLMIRAVRVLGLDFAALDYSVRADGSVVLWEANPYPNLPTLEQMRVPWLRNGPARVASLHRAVGDYLLGLREGAGPPGRTGP